MTRPGALGAPRHRPALSPQRLAHSSLASFAPALGRYSPPLCRRNKMAAAAARARCARIRPPSRPLGPRRRLARGGVRAHRAPGRRGSRARLCLLRRPARTRTCREHTPPQARSILVGPAWAILLLTPFPFLSLSRCGFLEGPRFPRWEMSPPLSLHGAERRTPYLASPISSGIAEED